MKEKVVLEGLVLQFTIENLSDKAGSVLGISFNRIDNKSPNCFTISKKFALQMATTMRRVANRIED